MTDPCERTSSDNDQPSLGQKEAEREKDGLGEEKDEEDEEGDELEPMEYEREIPEAPER